MDLKRLFATETGKVAISIILGLGLASLFRKVCTSKNCIQFEGPILSEFEGKTYKQGEKCYQYNLKHSKCDNNKKILPISNNNEIE
jgi:hypothetical protein